MRPRPCRTVCRERAAHSGGGFVDLNVVGEDSASVFVTSGTSIYFTTNDTAVLAPGAADLVSLPERTRPRSAVETWQDVGAAVGNDSQSGPLSSPASTVTGVQERQYIERMATREHVFRPRCLKLS